MLAATWGDITGSPGVCLSTRGPGAANMVNGVAHALLDRAPLIAITDPYSRPTYETGLRQRIDQLALYAPIVKWSTTIDAKTVRQQLRRAMRTATGDAAGPGAVRAAAERDDARGRRVLPPSRRCCRTGSCRARTAPDLEAGARHARRARRPILMVGLGVLLGRRLGRARRTRRAARRAGADHPEMQGRDPRGPSAARRLHHRRADRAQARRCRPT